ncbi:MAG TPA: hypothetical protein H9782_10050 [Candidatus Bariatricus faecipullorum]|nr:hypothetical protein [Candidatus Bariatricus faecipullorum]
MKKWKLAGVAGISMLTVLLCVSSGGKAEAEEYPEGAKLVRFNLHKSLNQEVGVPAGVPGYFTYYYEGVEYHYGFRFNQNGTGLETMTFGTAYVWAPYSLIHYDAAGGKFTPDSVEKERVEASTAYLGNVTLKNTRGDGKSLGNEGELTQQTSRYATDYTIYGNSLELSEGVMPRPEREGYTFMGWYVQTAHGEIQPEQTAAYAQRGEFGSISSCLNTPFTEHTKVQENLEREDTSLPEITLYAKWEKEAD